jgi:hypothetical protein
MGAISAYRMAVDPLCWTLLLLSWLFLIAYLIVTLIPVSSVINFRFSPEPILFSVTVACGALGIISLSEFECTSYGSQPAWMAHSDVESFLQPPNPNSE